MNTADRPPLRRCSCCSSRPWSGSRPTGRCSTPTALKDNPANRRPLIEEQTVKRGTIKTADGVTVAESHPEGGGKPPGLRARLPAGLAVRQPGRLQLRQRRARRGSSTPRTPSWPASATSSPRSSTSSAAIPQEGDNVTLTIDAQRAAGRDPGAPERDRLDTPGASGVGGAPWWRSTRPPGRSKAMASVPGYDPNTVEDTKVFSQLSNDKLRRADRQPRDPEHLPAGLDDEGGHRRRGARLGQVHAVERAQRRARRRRSAACRCSTPATSSSATST